MEAGEALRGTGRAALSAALRAAIAPLEGAEEAVVVADAGSLAILAVNRAARDLLDGRVADGRPLEWLFPDLDPGDLRRRVTALVRSGGRSMGITARVVWQGPNARVSSARLDVVRRDDMPLVVAFLRTPHEERVLRGEGGDVLAALPDREAFLRTLDAEARRASRHGRALSLVAMLVGLPPGTDASGETATAVTAGIAEHLRAAVRAEEPVARVARGGFAWLLPETGAEAARVAAERARTAVDAVLLDAGVRVRVGVAALVAGDDAPAMLARAEEDAARDPGGGPPAVRASGGGEDAPAALLRAALDGDARAVEDLVAAAFRRHGNVSGFDLVVQPAATRIRRVGDGAEHRSARGHRALALIEWALGRRTPVHPPPDAPVAVLLPAGVESRRVGVPAAVDAAAAAGWMPVVVQMPPAADPAPALARLGAAAVLVVLGDDGDPVEAGHLLRGLRESIPDVPLFAVAAPDGVLARWHPPAGTLPVQSAALLSELLLHARGHGGGAAA